jgi:transmembrane sensor
MTDTKYNSSKIITEQALEQAARWFVCLQERKQKNTRESLRQADVNRANQKDFILWLKVEENLQAWEEINKIHQQFQNHQIQLNSQDINNDFSAKLLYNNVSMSRRGMLKNFAGLSFASWLSWKGYDSIPLRNQLAGFTADITSAVGQSKQLTLKNNTKLWLNTNTAINNLTDNKIALIKGEVYLDNFSQINIKQHNTSQQQLNHSQIVTKSTHVETYINGKLLTLSTDNETLSSAGDSDRCSIMLKEDNTQCRVILYQGHASIYYNGQRRKLIVGEQLHFFTHGTDDFNLANSRTTSSYIQEIPPWLNGQIHANDIYLVEFVQELQRYRNGYICLENELNNIKVAGIYPAFNSNAALTLLTKALPIKVTFLTPWFVSISAKV